MSDSTAVPSPAVPILPVGGAIDVHPRPTLSWDPVPWTDTYMVELSTDPTFDEIYGALNRLHASRLIIRRRGRFAPARRGRELYEVARSVSKRTPFDRMDALRRLILCPCCGVDLKRVPWRISLTEPEFDAIVADYLGK